MDTNPVFKNKSALSTDHVPKKLVDRKGELRELVRLFEPFLEGGGNQKAVIFGPKGSGKTVLASVFGRELASHAGKRGIALERAYVDCGRQRTSWQAAGALLRSCISGTAHEGFSERETLEWIREWMAGNDLDLIVVLDDLGPLIRKEGSNFLYNLSRSADGRPSGNRLNLIVVVKDRNKLNYLDGPTRSSLFHNFVGLDDYGRNQLFKILVKRKEAAFAPGVVSEGVLELIAGEASESGSAAYAIAALRKAGEICAREGEEKVLPNHGREAIRFLDSGPTRGDLVGLRDHELLVLLALAEFLKKSGGSPALSGQLYGSYEEICEGKGKRPRGCAQFYKYVNELADRGLVEAKTVGAGRRGRSREVGLVEGTAERLKRAVKNRL